MPAEINYKKKYLELRSKYINDLDMAFRLGVEQGAQQAQQQQTLDLQEQHMQQAQLEEANANGEQPPKEEVPEGAPEEGAPESQAPEAQGSELDQHISKLESALGSSSNPEVKKSLEGLLAFSKSEKQKIEMKKAEQAIKGIAKALHKPSFKIGVQASHNLNDNARKSVSLQHKIVNDVMKAWEVEESKAKNELSAIVSNLIKE